MQKIHTAFIKLRSNNIKQIRTVIPDKQKTQEELLDEIEYLRAEVAYLKKLQALIQEQKCCVQKTKCKL